jgi:hypothetical protein
MVLVIYGLVVVAAGASDAPKLYAETGGLLDIPDVGYYSVDEPSRVNVTRLAEEVAELKTLVPTLTSPELNFNGFILFTPSIEDFVDYDQLNLAGGGAVFPEGDPHLLRTPVFAAAINETLGEFSKAGLRTHLVAFEPSYPPHLNTKLNLSSYASPDMVPFLTAKYCELKRRIPVLDGMVIYVADDWDQRADSRFPRDDPVYSGPLQMARFATALHTAIVAQCGLELLFSTWTAGSVNDYSQFVNNTPPTLQLIAHLQNSFRDNDGINPVVDTGGCRLRKTVVIGDMYRENDGWAHGLSVPATKWQAMLQQALGKEGCAGTAAFGSWGPGWTWPSDGPNLLNKTATTAPKSWAGLWNDFRLFTRGWTAQSAAVRVWSALVDNPAVNLTKVATEWASAPPLSLPPKAAAQVGGHMLESGVVWRSIELMPSCAISRWWMLIGLNGFGAGDIATCASSNLAHIAAASQWQLGVIRALDFTADVVHSHQATQPTLPSTGGGARGGGLAAPSVDAFVPPSAPAPAPSVDALALHSKQVLVGGTHANQHQPQQQQQHHHHHQPQQQQVAIAQLKRAVNLSELYIRTWSLFQYAWRVNGELRSQQQHQLKVGNKTATTVVPFTAVGMPPSTAAAPTHLCSTQSVLIANMTAAFMQWDGQFLREATAWQVTHFDSNLYSRPSFWPKSNNRSVAVYLEYMRETFADLCA